MAARKRPRAPRHREWIGGIVSLPLFVTGEGRPYRPQTIVWLELNGPVRAAVAVRPGEAFDRAAATLQAAIDDPMDGLPGLPARIRVASPELAETVRRAQPAIDVVCAPTPELDDFVAEVRARIAADQQTPSYRAGGLSSAQLASFFAAAAALFRARPWAAMGEGGGAFSVSIPTLEIHEQVLSVFGRAGVVVGLVLFRDLDDFAWFVDAAEAAADGEDPDWPAHLRLDFEAEAAIDPALSTEVAAHGWELASREAYPWPLYAEEDGVTRPATPDEVAVLEAIARALPLVVDDAAAIATAAGGGEPWTRALTVTTHAGELEVTLRVPPVVDERDDGNPYDDEDDDRDPLAALAWLVDEAVDGQLDDDRRSALEDRLVAEFLKTAEGAATSEVQGYRLFMDEAADACGVTIATASPTDLRQVLFDVIPRRVAIDASAAAAIVGDLRAFYRFLHQELALPQAPDCLRILDDSAVHRLATNLADRRRFGPGKALIMAGRDAGFDVDTQEGLEAWMREASSRPLPPSTWSPPPSDGAPPPAPRRGPDKADKKRQRKAARAARKRNR